MSYKQSRAPDGRQRRGRSEVERSSVAVSEPEPPPLNYGRPEAEVERRADGTLLLRARAALPPYPARVTDTLVHWASATPARTLLAQRDAGGDWRRITYGEMLPRVLALAEGLLACGLSAERPLVTLSTNSIDHAAVLLAAQHVGIPAMPLPPAYGQHGPDYARLRAVAALMTPGLVFVEDGAAYAPAVRAAFAPDVTVVAAGPPGEFRTLDELAGTSPSARVAAAHDAVGPDTIAKFLLTSGSTGTPKAVINTHRMLCANQAQIASFFAFVRDAPPVLVDWLPWNHTAGGNHNFNLAMFNGGALYIDAGKPTPALIGDTVRNLRDISPTLYFNVPVGFEMLIGHLRADPALRRTFFKDLKLLWYAAAVMPRTAWLALDALGREVTGSGVAMVTGLGMTETAPCATMAWPGEPVAGFIGLPAPGVTAKLAPVDGAYEARFKGPNVTPGYWRDPGATRAAFDDEGFYRTGDATRPVDPHCPGHGLMFEGRIAEDFKLSTGTWVRVARLREAVLAALGGLARDVVIAGPDRDRIGLLVFPDLAACRALCPGAADDAALLADPGVREALRARLQACANAATGSSNRVAAALLMAEPASAATGELTEKGTVNQRAVLRQRADAVETLYRTPAPGEVIHLS